MTDLVTFESGDAGRDGQPIVSLPEKTASIEYLDFTEPERDFYRAVFTRTKSRFDDFLSAYVRTERTENTGEAGVVRVAHDGALCAVAVRR